MVSSRMKRAIPEDLDARVINVRVLNLTGDFSNPVPFTVKAKISPVIQVRAVVDGAGSPSALAPGAVASIMGDRLAADSVQAKDVPVPRQLSGVHVRVNEADAPILLLSPNRISFQVPFETPIGPSVPIVVARAGLGSSQAVSVPVAEFAPVVYAAAAGDPYIVHGDFSTGIGQSSG
jgi:uncharacterized protein (TIGR03437 family)